VTSVTFNRNSILPISTINNIVVNNVNICSVNGSPGGNESPELSWINAPQGTRTFVVVLYDLTAAFTHWGMYNISGTANGLPENAGVAGSPFGKQVVNDFFAGAEYDGPCPPTGVAPFVHHYMFTVYALDIALRLPSFANFPATSETLYHGLLAAGRGRHILASASVIGLYSTTP
jgi:Raf kinase inhibitor-like YbhB/YbcL family protein